MEAHSNGPPYLYDQVKQQLRLQTDRPTAVREAIYNCRKGGSVFVLGVFAGFVDKFPLGAVMNKGLTLRGAQQHGHRYIPMILDRMAKGELVTEHLATHTMPLEPGAAGLRDLQGQEGRLRTHGFPAGQLIRQRRTLSPMRSSSDSRGCRTYDGRPPARCRRCG